MRSDAFGITWLKRAASAGRMPMLSADARVNARVQVSALKSRRASRICRSLSTAAATSGANDRANGVDTTFLPLRTNNGSPSSSRNRASELLTAEGVTCSRSAARTTLPSTRTWCSARIRFRSMASILIWSVELHHEQSLVIKDCLRYFGVHDATHDVSDFGGKEWL